METGVSGATRPRLFSVMSALIHTSWMAIRVMTGLPAAANWPTSVRKSVINPAELART
ncbi:hypothetical protein D3C81_1800250 [compost metagenome]